MPLTRVVNFKRPLERRNKVQVPKIIRWQFKMEPDQVLRIGITGLGKGWEFFYGRMGKDGRIFIPKAVIFGASGTLESQAGLLVTVSISPVAERQEA